MRNPHRRILTVVRSEDQSIMYTVVTVPYHSYSKIVQWRCCHIQKDPLSEGKDSTEQD